MEKESKILLVIILFVIIISAVVTYWKYMVVREFDVINSSPESASK